MIPIRNKIIISLALSISLSGVVSATENEAYSKIVISTRMGSADGEFGYKTYEDGSWIEPSAIVIDSLGNIFVSDPLHLRIQKFDKYGTYISKFTIERNKTPRNHLNIIDLTTDKRGNLYALSFFNYIFVFDPKGKLNNTISLEGKELAWDQDRGWYDSNIQCEYLSLDSNGNIYVKTVHALIKLDHKGNVLKKWAPIASTFLLDPDDNLFFSSKKNAWEMYDKNGTYLRVVNSGNNPYPASCSPSNEGCQFPPAFVDAKGNYYFFNLDSKTGALREIYKFSKEHKLIDKKTVSFINNDVRNMVKFDSAGNLYGPTQKAPSKKNLFPLILKIVMEN